MRLIDADALINSLKKDWPQTSKITWAQIVAKCAPTIDAVEVVRCKDCKHRDLFSCPLTENDFQKDEDFCSWGERKGGDTE